MASFASALGAVVGAASDGRFKVDSQYLTYPGFRFPLTDEGLKPDGSAANFDFVHRINMVPTDPPSYRLNGKLVWDEFARVIDWHELAINPPEGDRTATQFAMVEAQFGTGRLTPAENVFYLTTTLPESIEPAAQWSTIVLPDDAAVAAAHEKLPAGATPWLSRMNGLPQLGHGFVSSVRFDLMSIAILRPWLEPNVFASRRWTLAGEPLSDGAAPPRGRLPGYVTELLIIRNLTVFLGEAGLPDVGSQIMYRRLPGSAETPEQPPIAEAISDLALPGDAPSSFIMASAERAIFEQIKSAAVAAEQELGIGNAELRGGERFPVPIHFDVSAARPGAEERAKLAATELATAQAEYERLREMMKFARVGPGFWLNHVQRLNVIQSNAERAADALALLDQLAGFSGSEIPHVIALVCDRVPLCPNPDPSFFPQTS